MFFLDTEYALHFLTGKTTVKVFKYVEKRFVMYLENTVPWYNLGYAQVWWALSISFWRKPV